MGIKILGSVSCAKDFNTVRESGMSKMKLFLIHYLVLSPETFPFSKKSCRKPISAGRTV